MRELDILALLSKRYTETSGNGDAWAFIPKVRNAAGFNATRTLDAVAMSLWPSRGLLFHGFEIKSSRSDWLRELRNPAKADAFFNVLDRFWLVVGSGKVIQDGELPDAWGLLVVEGQRLVCRKEAPVLEHDEDALTKQARGFVAATLRSAIRELRSPVETEAATRAAVDQERRRGEVAASMLKERVEELEAREKTLAESVGMSAWELSAHMRHSDKAVAAFRAALSGDNAFEEIARRFQMIERQANGIAKAAKEAAGS